MLWLRKLMMLTRHEIRITGAEVSYLRKCRGKTRRDRIINRQIRGMLNEEQLLKWSTGRN